MGHHNHHKRDAYQNLQRRFDQLATGYPDTPATRQILRLLFTREEAELVARLPLAPRSSRSLARLLDLPEAELRRTLDRCADRGLIFDIHDERRNRSYYCLAPPVVGFIEFSLMRRRNDLDQGALAHQMERFFGPEPDFGNLLFAGPTQVGRALVHEEAVRPDDLSELLTWERAGEIVHEARNLAVTLCYCRHKAEHAGHPCAKPMDNCMSMELGGAYAIRHQGARAIDATEALEILARSREEGLVFIADNVQRKVNYVCSCCGCCCGQLQAINKLGLQGAVKTSAFVARIDPAVCTGCGRCARRCPVQAVQISALPPHVQRKARMYSTVDEAVCLGCGVCQPACRKGALTMEPRPERTLTPESTLERILSMALERDRLQYQIFDEVDGLHMALLARLCGALLRLPPVKRALASDALKSRFIGTLANAARGTMKSAKPL